MCGRAFLEISERDWNRRYRFFFGDKKTEPAPPASPDFRPTQTTTVVQGARAPHGRTPGEPAVAMCMPWGWHIGAPGHQKLLINARSETIAAKPLFKKAFAERRCVVPVSGFIEWKREPARKTPHRIGLEAGGILSLAGLWRPEGFIVLTLGANDQIGRIHDRMPVMLDEEQERVWLSDTQDLALLRRECLVPRPARFHIEATELPKAGPRKLPGPRPKRDPGQMTLF